MAKAFILKNHIIAKLREIARWWPPKNEAKRLARVGYGTYICARCTFEFGPQEIQVDHIEPVGSYEERGSWDAYISAMFVPVEKLQVLCKPCHQLKTNAENAERRKRKKEKKNV